MVTLTGQEGNESHSEQDRKMMGRYGITGRERSPSLWLRMDNLSTMNTYCGGLNEGSPHRLIGLSAWLSGGGTVPGGLGDVALLKEGCHWGGL